MKSVFEKTQCLKKGDRRSYVHELRRTREETAEDLKRYFKSKAIELGNLRVEWVNSFGEVNHHYTPTILGRYNEAMEKFYIRVVSPPEKLYVDEPQLINLKISNMSTTSFRLKLTVNEGESKTMAISAVSQSVLPH